VDFLISAAATELKAQPLRMSHEAWESARWDA
jgi:hypothetical protein